MKVIGLTGGIGTGKSTVAGFLAELGAVSINADLLGHEALKRGTPVYDEVVASFGKEILLPDGGIDRKKLGALVFNDREKLARLNAITHPWIFQEAKKRLDALRKKHVRVAVLEAALLIEAGWEPLVDEVWVTVAPEEAVLRRLSARDARPESEIFARIRAQLSQSERVKHADRIVNTDLPLPALREKVIALWEEAIGED